ncbi:hypothetical protein Sjap_010181 [Stephania japonica]|uniref:Small VCP/p97-interacting protein n=1 Tax=Stephania japonica TaxID=461633 RepID=A0AAP0J944_9MAGN
MGLMCCFNGGATAKQERRRQQDELESQDARARAAQAAQQRQEQFDKSAAGRAAKAQLAKAGKKEEGTKNGEPVLKVCGWIWKRVAVPVDREVYGSKSIGYRR